ncbi:hypothetical protein ABID92_001691 [Frigoribacterium sp. PvP120]|uniref:hypothetical protein n=1 Tax=unclassified Frigoribacterium TaxID=2627005 RepID=UPI001AE4B380|nr:hypothetical protein [Frigoribacterium sp. PvP121]MBP1239893.1 hypothetical protein [Frigoribacterium sp. PvP121]
MTIYMVAFLACGLWYWGVQLYLASVPLVLLMSGGEQSPRLGLLSGASGEPPVVGSSVPFWISCVVLIFLAVETVRTPAKYGYPLEPGFVTLYLLLSGLFAAGYSAISPDSARWPRDSIYPAAVLLLAAAVVGSICLVRRLRRIPETSPPGTEAGGQTELSATVGAHV